MGDDRKTHLSNAGGWGEGESKSEGGKLNDEGRGESGIEAKKIEI